jgi:DNA-binding FrmR family transcriptional regulator
MKVDLIADCARLAGQLEALSKSQTQLGQKAQESLKRLAAASRAMLHLMRQVSENYIDLTSYDVGDNQWSAARAWWDGLPAGRLERAQIDELVRERSATLARLYRASLDFTAITKFGDAELAFAREIGDEFRIYKKIWGRLKKLMADDRPYRLFNEGQARAVIGLFNLLLRHGLITKCDAQIRRGTDGRVVELAAVVGELRKTPLTDDDRLYVRYELDRRRQSLLTGGWFEAYSYHVFHNMLSRFSVDFELYSRVQYEANLAAKAMSRGDIDLLVSLQDQIMMVECKSAELSADEAARVVQKTRFLRDVFASTGVKEILFMLVSVPPETEEAQAALDRIEAEGIEVVEPQDIRTFLSSRLAADNPG